MTALAELKENLGAFKFYLLLIFAAAICIKVGFEWGQKHDQRQALEMQKLQQTQDNLQQENLQLTRRLNMQGVELEVEKLAAQKAQNTITEGLAREAALKRELSFFQKVMAPELTQEGFVIDQLQITPAASNHHFHMELVLLQQDKIKSVVKGNLRIRVNGSKNGQAKSYALNTRLVDKDAKLRFSFKYFQVTQEQFVLPEGFEPESISVHAEIFQFKRKRGELEKVFAWKDVLADAD